MKAETLVLSTGESVQVTAIPFDQYIRIMKRLGGVLAKKRPVGTSVRDTIEKAVSYLEEDMFSHCGVELSHLTLDDRVAVQRAARAVNAVDNLWDPRETGVLSLNARAMEMTLSQLLKAEGVTSRERGAAERR